MRQEEWRAVCYLVFEKTTEHLVGRCAFPNFQAKWEIPQFGISYFVRKSRRGQGYETEMAHALTTLAFKILKARKVEIVCDAENEESWHVPEKLNFELEYTQRGDGTGQMESWLNFGHTPFLMRRSFR